MLSRWPHKADKTMTVGSQTYGQWVTQTLAGSLKKRRIGVGMLSAAMATTLASRTRRNRNKAEWKNASASEHREVTWRLSTEQANQAVALASSAFPTFIDWEFEHEGAEPGFGFSMWGEYIPEGDDKLLPRRFFVTFDRYRGDWQGHVTIGKRSYIWPRPRGGDAWLVQTRSCDSLEEAIEALQSEMAKLFGLMMKTS